MRRDVVVLWLVSLLFQGLGLVWMAYQTVRIVHMGAEVTALVTRIP